MINDVKKKLWSEINSKIERHHKLSKCPDIDIAKRLVYNFIKSVEDINTITGDNYAWEILYSHAYVVLHTVLTNIDAGVTIDVSWYKLEENSNLRKINGVLIKWSTCYQDKEGCEAEAYIDVSNLIFDDQNS